MLNPLTNKDEMFQTVEQYITSDPTLETEKVLAHVMKHLENDPWITSWTFRMLDLVINLRSNISQEMEDEELDIDNNKLSSQNIMEEEAEDIIDIATKLLAEVAAEKRGVELKEEHKMTLEEKMQIVDFILEITKKK